VAFRTAALAKGSRFVDRYEILGELGAGSFGYVYQARQLSTGQSVAIKLLRSQAGNGTPIGRELDRFRRETRICAALSHVHIVQLIDSGEAPDGEIYAVFAHVPGETLEQALARDGPLAAREAVRLMTQLLDALGYAHANGVVHRDLKPSNLMLSGSAPRRNLVVLDFGLGGLAEARRLQEWQSLTQTREFLGTPLYASPEQLVGQPATARSDLYSWGLVFLECLTGKHPFEVAGGAARFLSRGGEVEIPGWLRGQRLGELLAHVTAREMDRRDMPIEAMIDALDEIARGELSLVPPQERPPPLSDRGERRHLAVVFCNLVASSGSQRVAAESQGRAVAAYLAQAAQAVARYGGHLARRAGNSFFVYFGYPEAQEDDAERAIHAGREILRDVETQNPRLESEYGVRLRARVAIHAGPVVVDPTGSSDAGGTLLLDGDTPEIAARLVDHVEPDTLLISDAMLRLVPGLFVTEDRGNVTLEGASAPICIHRVLQPSGVVSRLDRVALTAFVGREQELSLLLDRFEQVCEKRGQVIWISGEPGIGKSRLVHRLREALRERPHTWLECRSSPYTKSSALFPLIEMAEQAFGFGVGSPTEEKLARLERGLVGVGLEPAAALPLVASLLSVRLPSNYAPLEISPQLQRQKTLDALLTWVLALSERQPLVLLVEDLHWIDPTTLEWLGLLIGQCPMASILLILTSRPEFAPPWPRREHVLSIGLGRLRGREAKRLVVEALGKAAIPEALVDQIATRSDGVPLFVEELAKGALESSGALADWDVPTTLQDSLVARLDRLGEAKPVAQLAAAIAREFPYALLASVAPMSETALRDGLDRLVEAELLYQRGQPPDATYIFKHALVRDAAYQLLLDSQRKELHGRIADALGTRFGDRVAREPEVIAWHCEQAGRIAQAIGHYQRAGERAAQRWAHNEAIQHLRKALDLLGKLPEDDECHQKEIEVRLTLAGPLAALRGYEDPEAVASCARTEALCDRIGSGPHQLRPLLGLMLYHFNRGHLIGAREYAEALLRIAEPLDVPGLLIAGYVIRGTAGIRSVPLPEVCQDFEKAIAIARKAELPPPVGAFEIDALAVAYSSYAIALVAAGKLDSARLACERAIERGHALAHPRTLASALAGCAVAHLLMDDPERTRALAEECLKESHGHGFHTVEAATMVREGWARVRLGDLDGIAAVEEGEALASTSGTLGGLSQLHFEAADAYQRAGLTARALEALERGAQVSERTGESMAIPQVAMIRARILLQSSSGTHAEAERLLLESLDGFERLQSPWWALEPALLLARIALQTGNKIDEARARLVQQYAAFTEGFETARLREARALIDQLA
jgi:TOMM system kinase/cyclase fusion protein